MARILFTWELGGGFGHVGPHLALIDELLRRGHRIVFIMRDLSQIHTVFGGREVSCLQAPLSRPPPPGQAREACTYADILHNSGYFDSRNLSGLLRAWRHLFDLVNPDLAIFDHSPTALLASRERSFRRVAMGTGFFIVPDVCPLPNLRTWAKVDPRRLEQHEEDTLAIVNQALEELAQAPLQRLAHIFQVDRSILQTYAELDHYGPRGEAEYWGISPAPSGEAPSWPMVSGRRVFAYLRNFAGLEPTLRVLESLKVPTLVWGRDIPETVKGKHGSGTLCFAGRRPDLGEIARHCEVAVLNGNHDTTVKLLLSGIPSIHFPVTLEQTLMARRVELFGAGRIAASNHVAEIQDLFQALLCDGKYVRRAREFASKNEEPSAASRTLALVERMERML